MTQKTLFENDKDLEFEAKLEALAAPLSDDEIQWKVQSVTKKAKAVMVAYKDARTVQNKLDEVLGRSGWKTSVIDSNDPNKVHFTLYIWHPERGEWIGKTDTGSASAFDKEKGMTSDAFKRAASQWGIGRELYDMGEIYVDLAPGETYMKDDKIKASQLLSYQMKKWKITRDESGKVTVVDHTGKQRNVRQ